MNADHEEAQGAASGVTLHPIGHVETEARSVPRHWSLSNVEGVLVLRPEYAPGLKGIEPGARIVVLFHFHQSRPFESGRLRQSAHGFSNRGVFSICSPSRPNPIGLSVLEVLEVDANRVRVRGLDMFDGTPILDIKPHVVSKEDAPSSQ